MRQVHLLPLVGLFHRRYLLPAVAILHADRGAKFVTLVNRLGASREAVSATLKVMIDMGIAMRNPGYGHPMRPEYRLTAIGEELGEESVALLETVRETGLFPVLAKKWAMPVTAAIGHGATRFSHLEDRLGDITPRALTGALRELDRCEVVVREISTGWPPRPSYVLSVSGTALMPSLDRLGTLAARL